MALAEGTRLGPYEILSPIGAGGMGEVYRAKDTKLGREVAIKVLPEVFSQNRERLARFQREARLLASLNHPNIGAIHELAESDGNPFLVLEFVEGETLQERLKKGAPAIEEGLEVCRQVAEGLEAAHEKGVIHRDLKPANVMITAEDVVKVLDFGLARTFEGELSESEQAHSPTITQGQTQEGVILGTASYMSPEQARGKALDKRTDIWSFGCVLFEMLTGQKTFQGELISDVLASVLKTEPDFDSLPPNVHPRIRELLRRCLQKDPKKRLHDIADGRLEIEEVLADPGGVLQAPVSIVAPAGWQRTILFSVAALVLGVVLGITLWSVKPGPSLEPRLLARFPVTSLKSAPLEMTTLFPDLAISPDGRHIVYISGRYGTQRQLYLRPVDQLESIPIRGTKGVLIVNLFFSPDGSVIGFSHGSELKKVSIQGGVPVLIHAASHNTVGSSWGIDGSIIFGSEVGLFRVPALGGEAVGLSELDSEKGETAHYWPRILPDSKGVLFTIYANGLPRDIALLDLETRKKRILIAGEGGTCPYYTPTGHIVYARTGALWAVAFDPRTRQVTGEAIQVLEGVMTKGWRSPNFSLSDEGSLVYVRARSGGTLVWVDRKGNEEPLEFEPRDYSTPRISPEGDRAAIAITDRGNRDIWILDLKRQTLSRLTSSQSSESRPLWTVDGAQVVFGSDRKGGSVDLYSKAADGTGQVDLLWAKPGTHVPSSWSTDAKLLIFDEWIMGDTWDTGVLSMEGEPSTRLILKEEFQERFSEVSPDGAWIAYVSDETGQFEIYVRPFPKVEDWKVAISRGGGISPTWGPDGRELFYRNGTKMMAVSIQTEPSFAHGTPEVLFERFPDTSHVRQYDISPDDGRFLMIKQDEPEMVLVQNWFEELKRLVPTDDR